LNEEPGYARPMWSASVGGGCTTDARLVEGRVPSSASEAEAALAASLTKWTWLDSSQPSSDHPLQLSTLGATMKLMTLLVTLYTARGIVFAADSAITVDRGTAPTRLPKQEKFLRTKRVGMSGGVVGYFGLAQVGSEPMDMWLRRALDRWYGSTRVGDLGDYLRDELNGAVPRAHRTRNPSGFHIGAFESRDGVAVPVFQYVSNYKTLDVQTGIYSGFSDYRSEEHFPRSHAAWNNVAPSQMRRELRNWERTQGVPMWFRNGQLVFSARACAALTWAIGDITQNLRGSGFGLPDDLDRWEQLADTLVRTNGRLFALLNTRGVPTIEGPYRKTSIPWP
jgi:hypothetical protein